MVFYKLRRQWITVSSWISTTWFMLSDWDYSVGIWWWTMKMHYRLSKLTIPELNQFIQDLEGEVKSR